jgi:hypothetical protein
MAIRPAILLLLLLGLSTPLPALEIAVDYGHRHLHEGWTPPPADFEEGAVTATFAATAPIDTAFAQPGLERVDAQTWRFDFAWDQTDSLVFSFIDDQERLHEVRTAPAWPPFVPGEQTVPVVALDLDPSALWKPVSGIYVWGAGDEPNWDQRGEEWERTARFRWYDGDGSLQHDRTVGVRINGNFNR